MSTANFALLFVEGIRAGEAYPLDKPEVSLGRSRSNHITVDDERISRKHVVFRCFGDDLVIEDLDSAHGTTLNDKRLRGIVSVVPGDIVVAGTQKIKIVLLEEVAELPDATLKEFDAADAAGPAFEAADQEEDVDAKTRFGVDEDLGETRYHQAQDVAYDEEEDDAKTRVLADQATRMLDVSELQGLKPGKAKGMDTKKLVLGILLLVILLGGGGFAVVKYFGDAGEDPNALTEYRDTQHAFTMKYPAIWEKTSADPEAVITFASTVEGRNLARCRIFADQSLQHEITGLSVGFQDYQDTLKERHPGYKLKGKKTLDLNNMRFIQFGYSSDAETGLGLFMYNGPTRFVLESAADNASYFTYKEDLLNILKSFRLRGAQVYIDFPVADETIRHKALGRPADLAKEAQRHVLLAQDLLKRRQVRLDNLFRSVEQYRSAMQKAAALNKRPDFYEGVARELGKATEMLNHEIEEQNFKITMATKIGDTEALRFELSKLMQLIPDKNDPVYRNARKKMKQHGFL